MYSSSERLGKLAFFFFVWKSCLLIAWNYMFCIGVDKEDEGKEADKEWPRRRTGRARRTWTRRAYTRSIMHLPLL
jgi:hypothetical protein